MSQDAVEAFLGRIITDTGFRARAGVSLEQACLSVGYSLSIEELTCLKAIDLSQFSRAAETVDDAIRRS